MSVNTVSRALRAPKTVRLPLRQQIEAVARELNYVPNQLAGGLAGGRTSVVGVVITSLFYSEFAETIDSMQAELAAAGLSVMLGNSRYDPDEEVRLVRAMLSWRPAAIALVGVDHDPSVTGLLEAADVPVVEIWDFSETPIDTAIGMDHGAIGRGQVEHLLAQGYEQIAFVGAIRENDHRARKRCAAYAQTYQSRTGMPPIIVSQTRGGTPDIGDELTEQLLSEHPEIDGIAANSDVIAMGAMRRLSAAGRRVPQDVGIIGFGNNEAAACLSPTLSSFRPPRTDIGRAAAQTILERVEGGNAPSQRFDAELIARQSTAGPRP